MPTDRNENRRRQRILGLPVNGSWGPNQENLWQKYLKDTDEYAKIHGEIRQDRKQNPVVRAVNNWFGELNHKIKNNIPITGAKYVIPGLAAAAPIATATATAPGSTVLAFGLGAIGGNLVDRLSTLINGKSYAENISNLTGFAPDATTFMNPGYYIGGGVGAIKGSATLSNLGIYDKYTTLGGRFGYWGNNLVGRVRGTLARRFNFPDKARIPEVYRALENLPKAENSLVEWTGNKTWNGKPHVNVTTDRKVVSHSGGNWMNANTIGQSGESFLDQAGNNIVSIEPSDMFVNGTRIYSKPSQTFFVSGNVSDLQQAKAMSMQTLSSHRLRYLYKQLDGLGKDAKYNDLQAYDREMQRLLALRGRPFLKDYKLLEQKTGLNTGVVDILEKNNALMRLNQALKAKLSDPILQEPYIYPNGRIVEGSKIPEEINLINDSPYKHVFYDPTSHVEATWRDIFK